MIRSASLGDLPRIRELCARANDAPYDLARVAEEKCFGAGMAGAPEVRVWGDFAGISVTCGRWLRILAVDRARRGRGIGTALLRDAESRGITGIAAEAGNYFTPGVQQATGNRQRVLDFIRRTFGPIWAFEAARGTIFHVEVDGQIVAFAAHDANNRGLGFFGPTGVAPAHRGRKLGWQLLHACLADARRFGHTRVVIPWTDAISYYARGCGARIAHRFAVLRKAL